MLKYLSETKKKENDEHLAWSVLLIRPRVSGDELNFYKHLTLSCLNHLLQVTSILFEKLKDKKVDDD